MNNLTIASVFLTSGLCYGLNKAVAYVNRPRFEVNPPWQVKKVQHYKQYDALFQRHIRTIQLRLPNLGSENLLVFKSQRRVPTGEQDFCKCLLLELLDRSRSQQIKDVLDSLRDDSKLEFSEALAYVILVALEIPITNEGMENFKNVLCSSSDSFLLDFVLVHLTDDDTSLAVKASGCTDFDQYTSFLESSTPCKNLLDKLFSKVPVVNYLFTSYKIFKANDITPSMFRCFVQRDVMETSRVRAEYLKVLPSLHLGPKVLASNGDNYDPTFKVTPMNISYTYMRSYKTNYTSLQTQLGQLRSDLDFCMNLQDCKPIASSPLISPHLAKMKQIFLSTFQFLRKQEETLFQFEKAFMVARLCSNDFINIKDMRKKFIELKSVCSSRFIKEQELDNLKIIADKNMLLVSNLEKAFKLSGSSACPTLESLCQESICKVKEECKADLVMFYQIEKFSAIIERAKAVIEACVKLEDTKKKTYIQEAFSDLNALLREEGLLDANRKLISLSQSGNHSEHEILTREIVLAMVGNVSSQFRKILNIIEFSKTVIM